jgi:predicted nuclease with TOPRIM domain
MKLWTVVLRVSQGPPDTRGSVYISTNAHLTLVSVPCPVRAEVKEKEEGFSAVQQEKTKLMQTLKTAEASILQLKAKLSILTTQLEEETTALDKIQDATRGEGLRGNLRQCNEHQHSCQSHPRWLSVTCATQSVSARSSPQFVGVITRPAGGDEGHV